MDNRIHIYNYIYIYMNIVISRLNYALHKWRGFIYTHIYCSCAFLNVPKVGSVDCWWKIAFKNVQKRLQTPPRTRERSVYIRSAVHIYRIYTAFIYKITSICVRHSLVYIYIYIIICTINDIFLYTPIENPEISLWSRLSCPNRYGMVLECSCEYCELAGPPGRLIPV